MMTSPENSKFSSNPQPKTGLIYEASPFTKNMLKSLPPIMALADSPGGPELFLRDHYSPLPAGANLNDILPYFPELPTLPSKPPNARALKKLDIANLSNLSFQLNSVPVHVTITREEPRKAPSSLSSKSRPRKRPRTAQENKICCNCQKSKCLKLYCDCFAAGVYCQGCNCLNCHNADENDPLRREAIANTLDRNPNAFKPKFQVSKDNGEASHSRGCNCSKSACLKKYCECFQRGAWCSPLCNCTNCKNRCEVAKRPESRLRSK